MTNSIRTIIVNGSKYTTVRRAEVTPFTVSIPSGNPESKGAVCWQAYQHCNTRLRSCGDASTKGRVHPAFISHQSTVPPYCTYDVSLNGCGSIPRSGDFDDVGTDWAFTRTGKSIPLIRFEVLHHVLSCGCIVATALAGTLSTLHNHLPLRKLWLSIFSVAPNAIIPSHYCAYLVHRRSLHLVLTLFRNCSLQHQRKGPGCLRAEQGFLFAPYAYEVISMLASY